MAYNRIDSGPVVAQIEPAPRAHAYPTSRVARVVVLVAAIVMPVKRQSGDSGPRAAARSTLDPQCPLLPGLRLVGAQHDAHRVCLEIDIPGRDTRPHEHFVIG